MTNLEILADGSELYNFGKKRPVPNILELAGTDNWKDYLLNQWICIPSPISYSRNTFIKHILGEDKRLYQIVYSNKKHNFNDGVYKLYAVKVKKLNEREIIVDPQDFSPLYSPITLCSKSAYQERLLKEGYITQEEIDLFANKDENNQMAIACRKMNIDF